MDGRDVWGMYHEWAAARSTYVEMMMDVERVLRTRDGVLTSPLTCLTPAKSLHPIGASANSLN